MVKKLLNNNCDLDRFLTFKNMIIRDLSKNFEIPLQYLNKFINNAAWLHAVNSDTSHTTIDFAHVLAIHGFQLIQACNKIEHNEKEQNFYLAALVKII
ncbi:hypothetical protein BpHYR1_041227 [Brachionus plicatilis]|uniref:Uncharacterized protein n=1 Tax=Brachionus plicatilis TaxID=10195 RepID=A0A3M7PQ52_BRAPC|nr:hypothetical protein BpHYR1_041227 [Brachionus plicatilis]